MGEDEKKDYRLHLINTIDNAIAMEYLYMI